MPAYIIAEIDVTNPAGYEDYRPLAGASIAQYGGKFLVRGGGASELIEGEAAPKRVVVIEFADKAARGEALVQLARIPGGAEDSPRQLDRPDDPGRGLKTWGLAAPHQRQRAALDRQRDERCQCECDGEAERHQRHRQHREETGEREKPDKKPAQHLHCRGGAASAMTERREHCGEDRIGSRKVRSSRGPTLSSASAESAEHQRRKCRHHHPCRDLPYRGAWQCRDRRAEPGHPGQQCRQIVQ